MGKLRPKLYYVYGKKYLPKNKILPLSPLRQNLIIRTILN